MIPHTQTIFNDPARGDGHDKDGRPGDCWRTCVASLLDIEDLLSVPHFVEVGGEHQWWQETYLYVWEQTGKSLLHWTNPDYLPERVEYFIGSGPSPRGNFWHAVIVDRTGKLIHDPHPSQAGLLSVEEYFAPVERSVL